MFRILFTKISMTENFLDVVSWFNFAVSASSKKRNLVFAVSDCIHDLDELDIECWQDKCRQIRLGRISKTCFVILAWKFATLRLAVLAMEQGKYFLCF